MILNIQFHEIFQAVAEFGESCKVLPVGGIPLCDALPAIKQAFDISDKDNMLLVRQYDTEWNDFIDLEK